MFRRVLVANRGVIAVRIMRTLHKLGVEPVAIYSEADAGSPHVELAAEAICVGPAAAAQSYLNVAAILEAARVSNAEAIHPGYGFLSENPDFAEACEAHGVVFIGPASAQIRAFGLKNSARQIALECHAPILPGTGLLSDATQARAEAARIGYPVMLKSAGGGGGIGMRLCEDPASLEEAFESVQRLSETHFKGSGIYLERFVTSGRHIEVQVFGDGHGTVISLGERDCSVQRRNQKIIEETPAPGLSAGIRRELSEVAIRVMQRVAYRSAGTVEFLYDTARQEFYFLEVNTRLQVEHGVTEEVTGVDLVEWMVRLADGSLPPLSTLQPFPQGASIQVRLYAENPLADFQPSSGRITHWQPSPDCRLETFISAGVEITPFYDPLLAKIIVKGDTRSAALTRLQQALNRTQLSGIETNLEFLCAIAHDSAFAAGAVTTAYGKTFSFHPQCVEVLEGGVMTTIQDWPGRIGYWNVGVPPSGPMDSRAFRLGNHLLGNLPGASGLECTLIGPSLLFRSATRIAITGADMQPSLDGLPVPLATALEVPAGSKLVLRSISGPGARAYILFENGLAVPAYLGSAATFTLGNFGGLTGRQLRTGDLLPLTPHHNSPPAQTGTVPTTETGTVPTPKTGTVPTPETGTVPTPETGTVPTTQTGTVPTTQTGTVPTTQTETVPTPQTGTLPTTETGTVPTPQTGTLPTTETGTVPTPETGTVPTTETGTVPTPQTGTLPTTETGTVPTPETGTVPTSQTGTLPAPQTGTLPTPQTGTIPAVPLQAYSLTNEWSIQVLYGPHGAPDFFTDKDISSIASTTWKVHHNSSRTGVRLLGPKPDWARPDGGDAGLHPSNIHDNAYAIGSIDFTGDMPILLGPDGPSLGGFVCPGVIADQDLWKLGQLSPGDTVRLAFSGQAIVDRPLTQTVIRRAGDRNLLVEFGEPVLDLDLRFRAHALMQALAAAHIEGILDLTPGIRSLQIHYDHHIVTRDRLLRIIDRALATLPSVKDISVPTRVVHLPLSWDDPATQLAIQRYMTGVRADAPWCPSNLEFIRRANGLASIDDVYRIVFNASYLVLGLGDVYLGAPVATPLDPRHRLVTTKYNPARTWTPENAVGIGGAYLCVYGMEGPGGYQFVGRTIQMWNTYRSTAEFELGKPWLLRFFDQIRFFPVSAAELLQLRRDFPLGRYSLTIKEQSFHLRDYQAFLQANHGSIDAFRTTQQRAFAEERARWAASGEFDKAQLEPPDAPVPSEHALPEGCQALRSPTTASVWTVQAEAGQNLNANARVMVLEAMKMEIAVLLPAPGTIVQLLCAPGATVTAGQPLLIYRPAES